MTDSVVVPCDWYSFVPSGRERERDSQRETDRMCVCVLACDVCLFTVYSCIVPFGFLPWESRVAFPGESQLRQSRATRPTLHAGCFSVFISHRTPRWTTGSSSCACDLYPWIYTGDLGVSSEGLLWGIVCTEICPRKNSRKA